MKELKLLFRRKQKGLMISTTLIISAIILAILGFFINSTESTMKKRNSFAVYKTGNPELLPSSAKKRDNLIIGAEGLSAYISPVLSRLGGDEIVCKLAFESLITMDKTGNPVPLLAKDMQISGDGKTYSFSIVSRFFSNGQQLTLEDIEATFIAFCDTSVDEWDNIPNPYSKWISKLVGYDEFRHGFSDKVDGIQIEGDRIYFTFKDKQFSNIWAFLVPIFDGARFGRFEPGQAAKTFRALDIYGTGNYKITELKEGTAQLSINEYSKIRKPDIKEIVIINADPSSALYLFEAGNLDIYDFGANRLQLDNLMQTEAVGIYSYGSDSIGVLGINCRNDLLQDRDLRQAIAYAINKVELIERNYGQTAEIPMSILPDSSWMVPSRLDAYEYNPEKSISILEKSGYLQDDSGIRQKDGVSLEFKLLTYNIGTAPQIAEGIIQDLHKVGIQVVLEQRAYNNMQAQIFENKDFDLYYSGTAYPYEPEFGSRFLTTGRNNAEGWGDSITDEILNSINSVAEPKERMQVSQNFIKVLNKDLPQIPIDTINCFMMISPRIKGVEPSVFTKWSGIENYKITIKES